MVFVSRRLRRRALARARLPGRQPLGRVGRWAPAADVHCYTPPELERKLATLRLVRQAAEGVICSRSGERAG